MNTTVNLTLQYATRGLTGNREHDIEFLQTQIDEYRFDERVVAGLERILRCLHVPVANSAAA